MSFVKMLDMTEAPTSEVYMPAVPAASTGGIVTEETRRRQLEAAGRAERRGGEGEGDVHKTLSDGTIKAKYKIEVTFTQGRTVQGPNLVGIQVWESGKAFHGGGDELAFFCKDSAKGSDQGCWGVILSDFVRAGVAYCPHCERAVNAERLTNMKVGKVTSQSLAAELSKLFRDLDSRADIYLKYHKTDIHYIAMERAKGPDVAARLKGMHLYPLKNIIADTAAGADLTKRFHVFITS